MRSLWAVDWVGQTVHHVQWVTFVCWNAAKNSHLFSFVFLWLFTLLSYKYQFYLHFWVDFWKFQKIIKKTWQILSINNNIIKNHSFNLYLHSELHVDINEKFFTVSDFISTWAMTTSQIDDQDDNNGDCTHNGGYHGDEDG